MMNYRIFWRDLIYIATLTEQFFLFIIWTLLQLKVLENLVRFYTRLVYCQKICLHSHRNSTGRLRGILVGLNIKRKQFPASLQFVYYPLTMPSVCNTTNYFIHYTSVSLFISRRFFSCIYDIVSTWESVLNNWKRFDLGLLIYCWFLLSSLAISWSDWRWSQE
jgi:hypothetical protein